MKKLLFILMFIVGPIVGFTQTRFHYIIQVDGVTDLPTAKESTDWIRYTFNVYPTFNDSTNCFDFYANANVGETLILQKALDNNYTILIFSKAAVISVKSIVIEEEKK